MAAYQPRQESEQAEEPDQGRQPGQDKKALPRHDERQEPEKYKTDLSHEPLLSPSAHRRSTGERPLHIGRRCWIRGSGPAPTPSRPALNAGAGRHRLAGCRLPGPKAQVRPPAPRGRSGRFRPVPGCAPTGQATTGRPSARPSRIALLSPSLLAGWARTVRGGEQPRHIIHVAQEPGPIGDCQLRRQRLERGALRAVAGQQQFEGVTLRRQSRRRVQQHVVRLRGTSEPTAAIRGTAAALPAGLCPARRRRCKSPRIWATARLGRGGLRVPPRIADHVRRALTFSFNSPRLFFGVLRRPSVVKSKRTLNTSAGRPTPAANRHTRPGAGDQETTTPGFQHRIRAPQSPVAPRRDPAARNASYGNSDFRKTACPHAARQKGHHRLPPTTAVTSAEASEKSCFSAPPRSNCPIK